MTGVERLCEFAAGIRTFVRVCDVTMTAYDVGHMEVVSACLRDFLTDIADQIAREQDKVAQMDWNAVREVAADMSSIEFGSITVNGLLLEWSRKLTDAADGHGQEDDVSVSAYDLLPVDEREAIAWAREHGGLDAVKKMADITLDVYQRLVDGSAGPEMLETDSDAIATMMAEIDEVVIKTI